MPAKKQDVARTTIIVLLVLTILLSVISTWYVLDMITSVKQEYEAMPSAGYAKISVGVTEPGAESKPTINPITGKAIVNVGVIKS